MPQNYFNFDTEVEEEPWWKRTWNTINTPMANKLPEQWQPATIGKNISEWIDPERSTTGMKGYGSAFVESLGNTLQGFSSPLNVVGTAASGGAYGAAKLGLPTAARGLGIIGGTAAAPGIATGAHRVFNAERDPNTGKPYLDEQLAGLTEFVLSAAGTGEGARFARDPNWTGYGPKKFEAKPTQPLHNFDAEVGDLPLNPQAGTTPPIPPNFGPEAYAGPERRSTGVRTPETDTLFQDYRDRFARGEDVRSPQSQELFKKQQETNAFREEAGKAEQTYTQEVPEIGDIIVDKLGNDHEFQGYGANGKEIWKMTGNRTEPDAPLTTEQVVDEMPVQPQAPELPSVRTATEQTPVFNNEAEVRQHFGERLARTRTQYGSNSPQYGKLELEFKSALQNAQNKQGDLYGMSQMANIPDRVNIDPNSMEVMQGEPTVNASGESAASVEAVSRQRGMAARGEKFVVYDKAGNRREIIGPEAVDFHPAQGETYGIEYNDGRFSPLTHRGGKVPTQDFKTSLKDFIASTKKIAKEESGEFDIEVAKKRLTQLRQLIDGAVAKGDEFVARRLKSEQGQLIRQMTSYRSEREGPGFTDLYAPSEVFQPGKRGVADFVQRERPEDRPFKPGQLVRHKEHGIGRVSVSPEELKQMTVQELDLYRDRVVNIKHKDVEQYDADTLKMIDDEFYRRQDEDYGEVNNFVPRTDTPSEMAKGKTKDTIGMGANPDPIEMMRAYLNTYSEAGGRVATKELVQNAIDAAEDTGGEVNITLDHMGKTATVHDTGPGVTRHMIENEFTNLTESGKRGGPTKKIGEMGVGKVTYLLGSENFKVRTIAREPNGKLMEHRFEGVPEDMYQGKVPVNSVEVPEGTPTGTEVTIGYKDARQVSASHNFLKQFKRFSNTPVKINIESLEYPSFYDRSTGKAHAGYEMQHADSNIAESLNPRNFGGGKFVDSGTVTGGDYKLSIPPGIEYAERNQIALILMNRGMFQGIDSIHVAKGELPEAILVEIDPTVDARNIEYPLTAPTRERLKDTFKTPLERVINKEVVEKAAAARKQRIQDAYDSLKPAPGVSFVALDSGGRYTPKELAAFNSSPHIQGIGGMMGHILQELDALHPTEQLGKTTKFGFLLSDKAKGGINIPNPAAPYSAREFAILVNPFSAMEGYTPKQAARRLVHIIKHEFTHNKARSENASFTWELAETDSRYPIESESNAANRIFQIISDQAGNYAPEVQRLLQRHTVNRGRPDSTPDLLSEARASEWAQGPKQGGVSGGAGPTGAGVPTSNIKPTGGRTTPPITQQSVQQSRAQLYQLQNAHRMAPPGPVKDSLYAKIRDFNRTLLTGLDVSGAGRQGLPLIAEPEYWASLDDMFKSLGSQGYYDNLHQMVQSAPWSQKRYVPVLTKGGQRVISKITQTAKLKELPSFYEEWGVDFARHEESQGSKAAEKWIPGIKASNRAYNGFLTKLRFDTFNRMAQDLMNSGVDITKDIVVGKQLAEFVNNSTGRGSLGKLQSIAPVLNEAFFAPKLMAAKVRRYAQVFDPYTYHTMNPMIRRAAMKSLLSTAAFGVAFGELFRQMGADVNNDPTNSDFRKVKIGKLRIDPFGGDQQYLVAGVRLLSGQYTSPKRPNRTYTSDDVNEFFQNQGATLGNFTLNKLAPIPAFAWQLFTGESRKGGKFSIPEGIVNSTVPLVIQDITEIIKEDPNLLPLGVLPVLGMGTQTFGNR